MFIADLNLKMKNWFTIILLFLSGSAYNQNIKKTEVKEVTNKVVRKILTSLESHTVLSGKKLTINVFKVSNGSGSAHVIGDEEVSETYFFSITDSPGDENPLFKVASVGPFYLSKIIKRTDLGDTYVLTLEHFNSGKKQVHKILLGLNKVIYQ